MLTEIYISALLVDEERADQVWEAWDKGEIDEMGGLVSLVVYYFNNPAELSIFYYA